MTALQKLERAREHLCAALDLFEAARETVTSHRDMITLDEGMDALETAIARGAVIRARLADLETKP